MHPLLRAVDFECQKYGLHDMVVRCCKQQSLIMLFFLHQNHVDCIVSVLDADHAIWMNVIPEPEELSISFVTCDRMDGGRGKNTKACVCAGVYVCVCFGIVSPLAWFSDAISM